MVGPILTVHEWMEDPDLQHVWCHGMGTWIRVQSSTLDLYEAQWPGMSFVQPSVPFLVLYWPDTVRMSQGPVGCSATLLLSQYARNGRVNGTARIQWLQRVVRQRQRRMRICKALPQVLPCAVAWQVSLFL